MIFQEAFPHVNHFLMLCECSFFFFFGGILCYEKSRFDTKNVASDVQSPKIQGGERSTVFIGVGYVWGER